MNASEGREELLATVEREERPMDTSKHSVEAMRPGPARRADARGQSEVVGVVLLVAITLVGSLAAVTMGAPTIGSVGSTVTDLTVERALTQFDAEVATITVGDADSGVVALGDTGRYRADVAADDGWIRVVHHNVTPGVDEVIYNDTLGALTLQRGEKSVAYQAGGVWRTDGAGSVMVSHPAFSYRHQTLSLPVVRVGGRGSASGRIRAAVESDGRPTRVFPNRSVSYPTGEPYRNVLTDGQVSITVHSVFYDAWADYWRTRTGGEVTVDDANRTATVELVAYGSFGRFQMPSEGDSIVVRGMGNGHATENMTLVLAPDDTDEAKFDNLKWSIYAENGPRQFELHVRKSGGTPPEDGPCKEQYVSATVYYSDDGGSTYQGWHNETAFTTECVDRDGDGTRDEVQLVAEFSGDAPVAVASISSDVLHYDPSSGTADSQFRFESHRETVAWEPRTFAMSCSGLPNCREQAEIGQVTAHSLELVGPNVDLTVQDKSLADTVNEDASYGVLEYPGSGRITYLHVSENRIEVALE